MMLNFIPQMSPMDWLILSMFFLFIYFLSFMMIYFLFSLDIKNNNLKLNLNYYKLDW